MKSYDLLRQYVWLLETILQKGPISLEEINTLWIKTEMSGGIELSRYTFIRYKSALSDTFGIDINCDRRTNLYYISNPIIFRNNSIHRWMLSALTVSNIVRESLSLQNQILLEDIPCEDKILCLIIEAMKQRRCISFYYKKYNDIVSSQRLITPCCIKLFHQRWYVVDYNISHKPRPYKVFSFDRMSHPCITDKKFKLPKDFCANSIFTDSFGIFIGDEEVPQRIVIRTYGDERKYIRDLPLHHSQEILKETDNYTDYKYFIRPSFDFIAEIMSKGDRVEVIYPDSVRKRIYEELSKAAKKYEKGSS